MRQYVLTRRRVGLKNDTSVFEVFLFDILTSVYFLTNGIRSHILRLAINLYQGPERDLRVI